MEQETGYPDDEFGSGNGSISENGYNNEDESWSSYENLPADDFQINEGSAGSQNISGMYVDLCFLWKTTAWQLTCFF